MKLSVGFQVISLMCSVAVFTLLAWWNMAGPAVIAFLAMFATAMSLLFNLCDE